MHLEDELQPQGSAQFPLGTDVPVLGWPGRMQPHAWQPWEIPNVSLQLFTQNTCEAKDKFAWCHLLGCHLEGNSGQKYPCPLPG